MTEHLENYYNSRDEGQRLLSRHGQVEFLTTMHYINKYLSPKMRILDVGAGTGIYSHTLARLGYEVDALELVEHNIEIFKNNTMPTDKVTIKQGNALDLSAFSDDTYDIVLVFGPMYHLYNLPDKKKVMSEALRVLKKGGKLFVAYCIADASIFDYGFVKGHIFELLEKGLLDPVTFKASSTPEEVFELSRKEDIDAVNYGFAVKRLHYVATDLYTLHIMKTVDEMDDRTFELYMQYHLSLCEREDMQGLTNHSVDILEKL